MKKNSISDQTIIGTLLLIYWILLLILSIYGSPARSWNIILLGLILSTLSAMALFILMRRWQQALHDSFENRISTLQQTIKEELPEIKLDPKFPERIRELEALLIEYERGFSDLSKELENKVQENGALLQEVEQLKQGAELLYQEKENSHDRLKECEEYYAQLINDHQKTIHEQRETLQTKQQTIAQLESKVRDMSYEIKTILQIAERSPEPVIEQPIAYPARAPNENSIAEEDGINSETGEMMGIQSFEEALVTLKRCLDIAQRMTGGSHLGSTSRFKDLPMENYALDLRRLFDRLQNEIDSPLLVYSPKEDKILFVNDQIKQLLGISPEKFQQTFHEMMKESQEDWNRSIQQLSFRKDSKVSLFMKSRSGQELLVTFVLGIIPTGIFRNQILALLFAETKQYA